MTEHRKIHRIFSLIDYLARGKRSIRQLMGQYSISASTTYKYLTLLEDLGYAVEKDFNGNYFIFATTNKSSYFEDAELRILEPLISGIPNTSPLKRSIEAKIKEQSCVVPTPMELRQRRYGKLICDLEDAIANEQWVTLCDYHSTDLKDKTDRVVYPIEITSDNGMLRAFDAWRNEIRIFKIQRITSLAKAVQKPKPQLTSNYEQDIFGFTDTPMEVTIRLTHRAKNLLEEEYPKATHQIYPICDDVFAFEYRSFMNSPIGIGRFILGLPGEVKVIEPPTLIEYLNQKIKQNTFLAS